MGMLPATLSMRSLGTFGSGTKGGMCPTIGHPTKVTHPPITSILKGYRGEEWTEDDRVEKVHISDLKSCRGAKVAFQGGRFEAGDIGSAFRMYRNRPRRFAHHEFRRHDDLRRVLLLAVCDPLQQHLGA